MTALDPEVEIKCPKCRKTTKKALSRLKIQKQITCTCGETIVIEPKSLKAAVQGISDLNKQLAKFGK